MSREFTVQETSDHINRLFREVMEAMDASDGKECDHKFAERELVKLGVEESTAFAFVQSLGLMNRVFPGTDNTTLALIMGAKLGANPNPGAQS